MKSIRLKFVLAIMVTAVISLLFASVTMLAYNLYNYRAAVSNSTVAHASFLARAVKSSVEFSDIRTANNYVSLMASQPDVIAAAVYDATGHVLAYAGNPIEYLQDATNEPIFTSKGAMVTRPITSAEGSIGFTAVVMRYALREQLIGNAGIAVLVFLVATVLALALSLQLQASITRPILDVIDLANEIVRKKDYSLRAEKTSRDETGSMVDAINTMMAEVQRRDHELAESNLRLRAEVQRRILIERALRSSEQLVREHSIKLETANQELESFSYSVSHDLRTPLRALDGFSQALIEDYEHVLDDEGRKYLDRIRAASQRMGILIDDLLKLSRVSRYDLNEEPVNLSELVAQAAEELMAADPDRRVTFEIAPDVTASCDRHLTKIAIDNLVGNAWKYTGQEPDARIEFGADQQDGVSVFFVRDNGVGYDMQYAGKLFGAFQRLHTGNEFPGTGIGLATVRRIFRRHGGEVWGESKVGKGATFYFRFEPDPSREHDQKDDKTNQ